MDHLPCSTQRRAKYFPQDALLDLSVPHWSGCKFSPELARRRGGCLAGFWRGRLRPIDGAVGVLIWFLMGWPSGARLLSGIGARPQVHFVLPALSVFDLTLHLTTGSRHSLRSLGQADAGSLTKRYVP